MCVYMCMFVCVCMYITWRLAESSAKTMPKPWPANPLRISTSKWTISLFSRSSSTACITSNALYDWLI